MYEQTSGLCWGQAHANVCLLWFCVNLCHFVGGILISKAQTCNISKHNFQLSSDSIFVKTYDDVEDED